MCWRSGPPDANCFQMREPRSEPQTESLAITEVESHLVSLVHDVAQKQRRVLAPGVLGKTGGYIRDWLDRAYALVP